MCTDLLTWKWAGCGLACIYRRFAHLLTSFDLVWLDKDAFANAIQAKGAPLQNCFGFIDGTVRQIARPTVNQRLMFSGHQRVHCLKFQVIPCMVYIQCHHNYLSCRQSQLQTVAIEWLSNGFTMAIENH